MCTRVITKLLVLFRYQCSFLVCFFELFYFKLREVNALERCVIFDSKLKRIILLGGFQNKRARKYLHAQTQTHRYTQTGLYTPVALNLLITREPVFSFCFVCLNLRASFDFMICILLSTPFYYFASLCGPRCGCCVIQRLLFVSLVFS